MTNIGTDLKCKKDIIICGGGLSGITAALAARREGKDVLLIERYGFLGGHATNALVSPFMNYYERHPEGWQKQGNIANGGLFLDIVNTLFEHKGIDEEWKQIFDQEVLKYVLQIMLQRAGVQVLLHTFLADVKKDGDTVTSIICATKAGLIEFSAKCFVDATGDADLSRFANAEIEIGREEDGLCQPMTLFFRLANVAKNIDNDELQSKYRAAKARGEIKNPRENVAVGPTLCEGVYSFNSTRVLGKSPMDLKSFTAAEFEGREQVFEMRDFLRREVRGFENAHLIMTAPQIGVRESTRIIGDYVLTVDDLTNTVKFDDSIARGVYPVDIHNPTGSGTDFREIPPLDYYTIPYRSLTPVNLRNVIVAGRPISSTHGAHSAIRVMSICASVGEGAGTAAALFEGDFHKVDAKSIQGLLSKNNGVY